MMKRRHLLIKQKRKSVLFCPCFLCERTRVGENLIFRLKISLSFVLFFLLECCCFFFVVLVLNNISFHRQRSKNVFSLFSRPLLNTRVYIFLINALSKVVVVLLLLWSYDDGRRIFVNKLGSL